MLKAIAILEPTFAFRWAKEKPHDVFIYMSFHQKSTFIILFLFFCSALTFLKRKTERLHIPFHHFGFGNCEKANNERERKKYRRDVPS